MSSQLDYEKKPWTIFFAGLVFIGKISCRAMKEAKRETKKKVQKMGLLGRYYQQKQPNQKEEEGEAFLVQFC